LIQHIVRRLASMAAVLLIIISATFALMHAIPGGPFTAERNMPDAVRRNIEARYHLNDPLWKQYLDYLQNAAKGDLGPSFKYESRTVNDIIADGFPVSAELGCVALGLSLAAGIPAGAVSALYRSRWPDYLAATLTTLGMSVPSFILATILVYIFAIKLSLLPAAMWSGPEYVILPAVSLAALPTAFIARLTRSSILEVLQQDYIRTARAKGLPLWHIILRHVLKNALIPVVTYLGPLAA